MKKQLPGTARIILIAATMAASMTVTGYCRAAADGPGSRPEQQNGFSAVDIDNDGKVSWFEADTAGLMQLSRQWDRADRNGDGLLDQSEFADFMQQHDNRAGSLPSAGPATHAETARNQSANTSPGSVAETIRQAGQFKTFLHALKQAHVLKGLQGNGPYTVFAPTDAAFARMSAYRRNRLFSPDHVEELKTLLHKHIVPALIPPDEMEAVPHVEALTQQISITTRQGQLMADDARVVTPAMTAGNGIVYGIDRVLQAHFQKLFQPNNKP